jgi:hypothetical protein
VRVAKRGSYLAKGTADVIADGQPLTAEAKLFVR